MAKLFEIEGITREEEERLRRLGICSLHSLLMKSATREARRRLAEQSGIPGDRILEWAILAELMQVCGIGEASAILLREAGVASIDELAQNHGDSLYDRLEEANNRKCLFRRLPSERVVRKWISRARRMGSVVKTLGSCCTHHAESREERS